MVRKALFAALLAAFLVSCTAADETGGADAAPPPPEPIDAVAAVTDAMAAMGADGLDSITFSGTAWNARNGFMQTPNASPPWTLRDEMTNYVRTIDLTQPASRATADTFASDIFFSCAGGGDVHAERERRIRLGPTDGDRADALGIPARRGRQRR